MYIVEEVSTPERSEKKADNSMHPELKKVGTFYITVRLLSHKTYP